MGNYTSFFIIKREPLLVSSSTHCLIEIYEYHTFFFIFHIINNVDLMNNKNLSEMHWSEMNRDDSIENWFQYCPHC